LCRANFDLSELYVQTVSGSVKYWLANGGSAEAAFESGRAAAKAILKAALA